LGENANELFQNEFIQKEKDGRLGDSRERFLLFLWGKPLKKEWLIKIKKGR